MRIQLRGGEKLKPEDLRLLRNTLSVYPKALLAAIETGLCPLVGDEYDTAKFEQFWTCYREKLLEKQAQELDQLGKVLEDQRKERASQRAKQRIHQLTLAVLFVLSDALCVFLGLLLKL